MCNPINTNNCTMHMVCTTMYTCAAPCSALTKGVYTMGNIANKQVVAPVQGVVAQATVVVPATLRAVRVARVQAALHRNRIAAKQVAHVAKVQAANNSAYLLAVQQLAAQYGVAAPNTLSVRSVHTPQQHAPSTQPGACARVHAIAAQCNGVRSTTLAMCKQAGINPATAATQYAKYRKANML